MLGCSLKAVKSFVAPAKQFAVVAVVGVINLKLAHTDRKARDTENIKNTKTINNTNKTKNINNNKN